MNDTLMTASNQFMSRPDDQRFASLTDLDAFVRDQRERSRAAVLSSKKIGFTATEDGKGLQMVGRERNGDPTHWSFNQLAGLAAVPAGLLRKQCEKGLASLAADNLNAGFGVIRDVDDVGILARDNGHMEVAAATGPRYGRVWNADITRSLVERFGDGVSGDWKVPGMFGKALPEVTKANTTLYASDRDMFVFLADEEHRIEIPNRRNGQSGSLARGFFVYNSEVGSKTLGLEFFLFDYVCCNRIVWGVEEHQKIAIRHTVSAPDKWLAEITPTLLAYSESMVAPVEARIKAAQQRVVDDARDFLSKRQFNTKQVDLILAAHQEEEGRPIETVWDAVTGVTAYAKQVPFTDDRVDLERAGGKLLDLVAA